MINDPKDVVVDWSKSKENENKTMSTLSLNSLVLNPIVITDSSISITDGYKYANENKAMYMRDEEAFEDRQRFVYNLGVLVSQTRNGVIGMSLDENDIVTIKFKDNIEKHVNVRLDSYTAIIRDVCKHIG